MDRRELPSRWKAALREPMAHFLLGGIALFVFFAWRGEPVDPSSRTITIDEAQVTRLSESFVQTWRRPPTRQEIDGMIRDYIKEEVYYREALRLGLDADDVVIRRRLRAKMEFLAKATAESAAADTAILQAWLDRHPVKYAQGSRYSFDQIYLGADANSAERAAGILDQLRVNANWQGMGEAISLPKSVEQLDRLEIAQAFGDGFASEIETIGKQQGWRGPVQSGFGRHLVRVRAVEAGRVPRLEEVRQRVENDWRAATQNEREARAYQSLLDAYTIRIAKP